jgi:hypothetical protein
MINSTYLVPLPRWPPHLLVPPLPSLLRARLWAGCLSAALHQGHQHCQAPSAHWRQLQDSRGQTSMHEYACIPYVNTRAGHVSYAPGGLSEVECDLLGMQTGCLLQRRDALQCASTLGVLRVTVARCDSTSNTCHSCNKKALLVAAVTRLVQEANTSKHLRSKHLLNLKARPWALGQGWGCLSVGSSKQHSPSGTLT